jgi:hypothetical protein
VQDRQLPNVPPDDIDSTYSRTLYLALEDQLNSKSGALSFVVSAFAMLALAAPALKAQTPQGLPHSPMSSGVLAADAYRAGLQQPESGQPTKVFPTVLTCSTPPCVFPNVQASAGPKAVNDDPIAVNPNSASQILTGGNDYNCANLQGFYASSNDGGTWTHTCAPGSGGQGDPIVGYDLKNHAYAGGVQNSNVVLFSSNDNGLKWGPVNIVTTPLLGSLADKPWLEIDTNTASPFKDTLYVSATQRATNNNSQITVSHSTDTGKTWTTHTVDTEQTFPDEVDQFSDLSIGPEGTVYVSWLRCPATSSFEDCGGQVSQVLISKSSDQGNTWSTPVVAATPTLVPDVSGCCFYGQLPNTSEPVSNVPSNAVFGSGSSALVYVCMYNWNGSQMQVEVVSSTDGGATFGAPVRVSTSNKGDEFFQWIAMFQTGELGVTWLDRRKDPKNVQYQPYSAFSTTNGVSFSGSTALSTTLSNPLHDGFGGTFMGDSRTHVWVGHSIDAVWMDTRTGVSQDEAGGLRQK